MELHGGHHPDEGGADDDGVARAHELLKPATLPLLQLVLDPGDELSAAAGDGQDESMLRSSVTMHAYQRLVATGLEGVMSVIANNPATLRGRILVRALDDRADSDHVVVDGSRHVAALRQLAIAGAANGAPLGREVTALFQACPVSVVHRDTDPAFVLALLADGHDPAADGWLHGQRDRLLRRLAGGGVHHSLPTILAATEGNPQTLRRYHAYRALGQLQMDRPLEPAEAAALYPLFHAAVGRAAIRTWLDWDDALGRFVDDDELERFYALLLPDDLGRPARITVVSEMAQLCDVLAEPGARSVLFDHGASLADAVEVIDAGAFQQWSAQIGEAYEAMQWNRRRFGSRA